jgi:hypothetical protein
LLIYFIRKFHGGGVRRKIPGGGQVFSLGNSRQGGCHLPNGSEIPKEGPVKIMHLQGAVFKNCLEIPRDPHKKPCFWKFLGRL